MGVRTARSVAAGLMVSVGVLLAGCTSPAPPPAPPPEVVVPGSPGEAAEVVPADEVEQADPEPTEADVRYLGQMVVHHEQAVLMTDLAAERVDDPQVRAIAERINGTQRPEIAAMQQLLSSFEVGPGHDGPHGGPADGSGSHAGMPGMATPAQLEALRAASGDAFDELFLDLMVAHHLGALSMAEELLGSDEVDVQVELVASDVIATQNAEIRAMEGMSAS